MGLAIAYTGRESGSDAGISAGHGIESNGIDEKPIREGKIIAWRQKDIAHQEIWDAV